MVKTDEEYMTLALAQAQLASALDEVPVGALLIDEEGDIIATGHNLRETTFDPTGHAELLTIAKAAKELKKWRLAECTLFVTLEPCLMCAGAIILSRLRRVVFGASDPKAGAVSSLYSTLSDARLNHRPLVTKGVLESECGQVLKDFFAHKRAIKDKGLG